MEAKEKAKKIYKDFYAIKHSPSLRVQHSRSKACALIMVNEILSVLYAAETMSENNKYLYWNAVRKEIDAL